MGGGKWLFEVPLNNAKVNSPFREVFYQVTSLRSLSSEKVRANQTYISMVLAEVIRREWDSKFKVHSFRGDFAKFINTHGEFWHRTLHLTEKLSTLYPYLDLVDRFPNSPAFQGALTEAWFMGVLLEGELDNFWSLHQTKTGALKEFKSQNQMLSIPEDPIQAENPFRQEYTKALIDGAFQVGNKCDVFRKKTYTPWLKSRKALGNLKDLQLFTEAGRTWKQSRQGRKK